MRAELIGSQEQGFIAISRVALPDAPAHTGLLADVAMRWSFRRWGEDSPLRRAALAGLTHLHGRLSADLGDIDLAGQRLPTPGRTAGERSEARWWIRRKWQDYQGIPYCVTAGQGWLEVIQPTRTRPLNALLLRPGPNAAAWRG